MPQGPHSCVSFLYLLRSHGLRTWLTHTGVCVCAFVFFILIAVSWVRLHTWLTHTNVCMCVCVLLCSSFSMRSHGLHTLVCVLVCVCVFFCVLHSHCVHIGYTLGLHTLVCVCVLLCVCAYVPLVPYKNVEALITVQIEHYILCFCCAVICNCVYVCASVGLCTRTLVACMCVCVSNAADFVVISCVRVGTVERQ